MTNPPSGNSLPSILKADAARLQPSFSPALHERIISRLQQQTRLGAAAPIAAARFRPLWRWPAAAAALLAVAGTLWVFSTLNPSHPGSPPQIGSTPPTLAPASLALPSLAPVLQTAVNPTRAKLEDGKYAYLDHDARRFAGFVLSQLPGQQGSP